MVCSGNVCVWRNTSGTFHAFKRFPFDTQQLSCIYQNQLQRRLGNAARMYFALDKSSMLWKKQVSLGNRKHRKRSIHDLIAQLRELLWNILNPHYARLLRSHQKLGPRFTSLHLVNELLMEKPRNSEHQVRPPTVRCVHLHRKRHSREFPSLPRTTAPFARIILLISWRSNDLGSGVADSIGKGQERKYRTMTFAPHHTIPAPYLHLLSFYNVQIVSLFYLRPHSSTPHGKLKLRTEYMAVTTILHHFLCHVTKSSMSFSSNKSWLLLSLWRLTL